MVAFQGVGASCPRGSPCHTEIVGCCAEWGDVCCNVQSSFCCEEGCCLMAQDPQFWKWFWVVTVLLAILIVLLMCMVCRCYHNKESQLQQQSQQQHPRPARPRRAVYEVLAGQVFPAYTVVPGAMGYQAHPNSIVWYSPRGSRRGSEGGRMIPRMLPIRPIDLTSAAMEHLNQQGLVVTRSPPPPYERAPPTYDESEAQPLLSQESLQPSQQSLQLDPGTQQPQLSLQRSQEQQQNSQEQPQCSQGHPEQSQEHVSQSEETSQEAAAVNT